MFFVNLSVVKAEQRVKLTLFYSQYCPHCEKEKVFLKKLQNKYSELEVKELEVDKSAKNQKLFREKAQEYQISQLAVPLTIIGQNHFLGYESDETTGATIEQAIKSDKKYLLILRRLRQKNIFISISRNYILSYCRKYG